MGNIRSIANAFSSLGINTTVTNQPNDIENSDKIILPGVGAFGDGMQNLKNLGLINSLTDAVMARHKPVLGICLGMQLLADTSEEFGFHSGLGWISGKVRKYRCCCCRSFCSGTHNLALI
jgi:glutamine amidotransferase